MLGAFLCWVTLWLFPGGLPTCARSAPDPFLLAASSYAADLQFPSEANRQVSSDNPGMTVYKPDGVGPFPGLVLFHQCAGLGTARRPNRSMFDWAKQAVFHGYAVLLIDSLVPRRVDTVCLGPKGGVNLPRGVKDALQAAEHLRRFEFVDKKKVALAGYSWGAMVALLASSKHWRTTLAPGQRFNAVISFYPGCRTITPQSGTPYEIVQPDIDAPLLVLMGELDNETPASECVTKLDAVGAADAPVEWHVYSKTTHCWDCSQLDQNSKIDARGNRVTYRYDENVSRDSARRMFEFLEKTMGTGFAPAPLATN